MSQCRKLHKKISSKLNDPAGHKVIKNGIILEITQHVLLSSCSNHISISHLFQDITNRLLHVTASDMIVFDESQL